MYNRKVKIECAMHILFLNVQNLKVQTVFINKERAENE